MKLTSFTSSMFYINAYSYVCGMSVMSKYIECYYIIRLPIFVYRRRRVNKIFELIDLIILENV